MIRCPVCKLSTGFFQEEYVPGIIKQMPYPLYQRSYNGEPEYISERCSKCYDKAEAKLLRKRK